MAAAAQTVCGSVAMAGASPSCAASPPSVPLQARGAAGRTGSRGVRRRISFGVGGASLSAAVGDPLPALGVFGVSEEVVHHSAAGSSRNGFQEVSVVTGPLEALPGMNAREEAGGGHEKGEGQGSREAQAIAWLSDKSPRLERMVRLARLDLARAILVGVPAFFAGAIVLSLTRVLDAARTSPAIALLAVPVLVLTVFVSTRTELVRGAKEAGRLGARAILGQVPRPEPRGRNRST